MKLTLDNIVRKSKMKRKTYSAGEETKQRILDISKTLFYEKGFSDTLYDDICKLANVNRALIPYHFKNKYDLALAVYNSYIAEYVKTRNQLMEGYSKEKQLMIGIYYFYKLMENPHVARFADFIFHQQDYEERLLFGESVMFQIILNPALSVTEQDWDCIVRLIWGMEIAITRLFMLERYNAGYVSCEIMVRMFFHYFGYSDEKITQLISEAKQLIEGCKVQVMPDFTIVLEQ